MGIFSSIRDKIFGHRREAATATATAAPRPPSTAAPAAAAPTPAAAPATTTAEPQVDVEAVLTSMAEMQGGGGNWRTSIVDLLKLLHMDSSLQARKELADELGVHAGEHGSAEQNVALHKAVMKKLAENGGMVPDSFYR